MKPLGLKLLGCKVIKWSPERTGCSGCRLTAPRLPGSTQLSAACLVPSPWKSSPSPKPQVPPWDTQYPHMLLYSSIWTCSSSVCGLILVARFWFYLSHNDLLMVSEEKKKKKKVLFSSRKNSLIPNSLPPIQVVGLDLMLLLPQLPLHLSLSVCRSQRTHMVRLQWVTEYYVREENVSSRNWILKY